MNNKMKDADELFRISKKGGFEDSSSVLVSENDPYEINEDSILGAGKENVLCILYKNGRMGASFYNITEKMLYVVNEMYDSQPEYLAIRSLLREINPLHILTVGSHCDKFVKSLIEIISNPDLHTTVESDQLPSVPNNLSLLTFVEYTYNTCEYRIKSLNLMSEPEGMTEDEHELYLHSLINFQSKLCVHSLGALIKFTEKSWTNFKKDGNDILSFHHINQISLADHVFIDHTTFNGLQVFQLMSHDARFKHGTMSTSREGISLFRLFSQYCKSKIGCIELRNLMLKPIKNIAELNKRLDFISFVQDGRNRGFVDTLQDSIRHIADINMILGKIQHSRGSNRDWHTLYKTIYHILFLNELCTPYVDDSPIFMDLSTTTTEDLYGLERCIDNAMDFKPKVRTTRPGIKEGLDATLDKNKLIKEDIGKQVNIAAKCVIDQLPPYLEECTVFYIPDMGHVIAVKKWEPNCDFNELINFGFQFMFELNDRLHYKNALCQELDNHFGDIQTEIISHENRIIERVAAFVLRYNNHIRRPMRIIALIDCLISMAKVAHDKGYARPQYNTNNIHEIKNGRHPLLEFMNQNFVSNDFYSGGKYKRMKIITGPNASGKSVYLKQTTLLIYLAHIGSYIPAESVNISMVHSIHTRMHATESAILHLSAFMIDLTQMSQALYNAKPSSLIIMDEFGRGTTGREGLALLTGALRQFLREHCPHVIVSTHLQIQPEFLDDSMVLYQTMEHTRDSNTKKIVFLFKVVEGSSTSYALDIAASVDLDADIVLRAKEILNSTNRLSPLSSLLPARFVLNNRQISSEFLMDLNIPSVDEL